MSGFAESPSSALGVAAAMAAAYGTVRLAMRRLPALKLRLWAKPNEHDMTGLHVNGLIRGEGYE